MCHTSQSVSPFADAHNIEIHGGASDAETLAIQSLVPQKFEKFLCHGMEEIQWVRTMFSLKNTSMTYNILQTLTLTSCFMLKNDLTNYKAL